MLNRKLIASVVTIVAVLLSELLWPSSSGVPLETRSSAQSTSGDWSALVARHRHIRHPPAEDTLPAFPAPMALPISLVSLLRDGTNWKISAAGDARDGAWAWLPLSASSVEVNDGEGYVMVDFAHSPSDSTETDADASRTGLAAHAHRGLQSLACEEHGGGVTRVSGRCFLTLDDPADVTAEAQTVSFSYEVMPSKTAHMSLSAKRKQKMNRQQQQASSATAGETEARVLAGASGWLQLERDVDGEAGEGATPTDTQDVREALKVGAITVREGVTRAGVDSDAAAAKGFNATIQFFFFPAHAAQGNTGLARLFPAGVELSGVHGSFVQVDKQRAALSKKVAVTVLWHRYVTPCVMAGSVYAAARVLTLVLTRWVDRQQQQHAQKPQAGAASPAEAHPRPAAKRA